MGRFQQHAAEELAILTHLRVRFDGKIFVPEQPVDLVAGQLFEIAVKPVEENAALTSTPLQRLADAARLFAPDPEAPPDGAAQHDHYLYGTPKRDDA